MLIITTPNGARIKTGLPTFSDVAAREQRKQFRERQFRPSGKDHLFLFRLNELKAIVPKKARIIFAAGGTREVKGILYMLEVFQELNDDETVFFLISGPKGDL